MSDDFERRVRDWLHERGRAHADDLAFLAGNVAALPPRRPNRRRPLLAAAVIVAAVGLVAAGLPRVGSVGTVPTYPPAETTAVPPDPAAFAGDPRLASCGGLLAKVTHAFELARARDYRQHIPAMGLSPELDVDEPAFVVVFAGANPFGAAGGAGPRATNPPGHRDVCVLVAEPDGSATRNVYTDVDIAGLTAAAAAPSAGPSTPPATPPASVAPSATAAPTRQPPPDWAEDLLGALACDGTPQLTGHERGGAHRPVGHEGTASPYPWLYAVNDVELPVEGWREDPVTSWHNGRSHFVRYVNEADGAVKAVLLMEGTSVDGGQGRWSITAFQACPADEFDPLLGRTTDDAPWTDATGAPTDAARTSIGPAHCGWHSTVWLRFEDQLYIRDPEGLFADVTDGTFDPDASLPTAAADTGLGSVRWHLFTTADRSAVWVRADGGGIERWPRSRDPFLGCA